MPWLLLLLSLFIMPLHAATIPGVTSTSATPATSETAPAAEPDLEQKKAAYAALADVLENTSSREELIGQL